MSDWLLNILSPDSDGYDVELPLELVALQCPGELNQETGMGCRHSGVQAPSAIQSADKVGTMFPLTNRRVGMTAGTGD